MISFLDIILTSLYDIIWILSKGDWRKGGRRPKTGR